MEVVEVMPTDTRGAESAPIRCEAELSRSGQLVEIAGEYLGNPIEDILVFFNSLFPYTTNDEPETEPEPVSTAKASATRRGRKVWESGEARGRCNNHRAKQRQR
jgi:hypothetical protein